MEQRNILVLGAGGQLGTELVRELRAVHGPGRVIASDIREKPEMSEGGPFEQLDILNQKGLGDLFNRQKISQVYLLAALLSASGELRPGEAWDLNMRGLLQVLELARQHHCQVFWPSSIAVFGHSAPRISCPNEAVQEPSTVYGISKSAGELWCRYYFERYGVDVRSVRYPGLISYEAVPGGGTTDYAVEIFEAAVSGRHYPCYLRADTRLPMMYMPDAIRAALEIMAAPAARLSVRTSYNVAAVSFTPRLIAASIQRHIPELSWESVPDYRQKIAESWPGSIDDSLARHDWNWKPRYGIKEITDDMIAHVTPEKSQQMMEKI